MWSKQRKPLIKALVVVCCLLWIATLSLLALAQLNERPADPLGRSIRVGRIQVIHSDRFDLPGTSMALQQTDPWLAYEMGRAYFQREWTSRDGVFLSLESRPPAAAVNSCAMCHNTPFGSAGGGGNIADPPGFGRNTPHLFGIGLIETLGIQIRQQLLADFDTNGNRFLDVPSETKGRRAIVRVTPGVSLDFGSLEDLNGDGHPELNEMITVTLVDANGRPRRRRDDGSRSQLGDPEVAGYDFVLGLFSSSIGDHQFPTLRSFTIGAMQTVFGLPIEDPTISHDGGSGRDRKADDGWAETSNAGAPQPYFPMRERKIGNAFQRVSAGELDLLEWFLLNQPAPAIGPQSTQTRFGRELMKAFGCTSCHVSDWEIQPGNKKTGMPGDRRFFDLSVSAGESDGRFSGRLRSLANRVEGRTGTIVMVPRRQGFIVRDIFTDLRHHDVGERFYEYTWHDNHLYVTKRFRTPPLWGVGSTLPYGHDGRSLTLDDVIRRHGGEAEPSARAYASASASEQAALVAFLRSLILYQPDLLPTDLNSDGRIAANYRLHGLEVGPELFRPELMFRVVPRYIGWIERQRGDRFFSYELLNLPEVYGRRLEYLNDADGDGLPDVLNFRRSQP
jgi:hypothetical protein